MGDLALGDQPGHVVQRNRLQLQPLVKVGLGPAGADQIARQEGEAAVVLDRRVGMDPAQLDHLARLVAGLLAQLAAGRVDRGLARIAHAARDLQRELLDAVPVLAHHEHPTCVGESDHVDPIRRV